MTLSPKDSLHIPQTKKYQIETYKKKSIEIGIVSVAYFKDLILDLGPKFDISPY